jgi:hypothetical protein
MNKLLHLVFPPLMLIASASFAQQPVATPAAPLTGSDQSASTPKPAPGEELKPGAQQGMGMMQNMDKMATTVTRVAEMCEQMMKMEMEGMPLKRAAGIGFGVLVTIVLLLLTVLEVQWIIYWSRLLKEIPKPK